MMFEKLFKAKFTTAKKTLEQLKAEYTDNPPTEVELQSYLKAYQNLDGVEVIVYERHFVGSDNYGLFVWNEGNKSVDEKIRDFFYQVEQDAFFGQYIDEREEFLIDWEAGDYAPVGSVTFKKSDVEIIEELKKGA